MKKQYVKLAVTFMFTFTLMSLFVMTGCGGEKPGDTGPAAPSAVENKLFSLLPADSAGVFSINIKKLTHLEFFDKMIKEAEAKPVDSDSPFDSYNDFVAKSGIDPKKDIYGMAAAIYGPIGPAANPDVVVVVQMNFDQNMLLRLMKAQGEKYAEETYKDVAVYNFKDSKGKDMSMAFVAGDVLAAGYPAGLKKVIDLSKGEGQSALQNNLLKGYMQKFDTNAILSFAMQFPEAEKKVRDGGMFKFDLSKAEALVGHVDYSGGEWQGKLVLVSHNPEGNDQLVSTLNGMKMMGAALGPEIAELLTNMDLSAKSDSIVLKITISDELLEKLQKFSEKQKGMGGGMM
jgi:hypothetical protein